MLGRLWQFVRRHKRKFLFAGVLVGGGILLKNYAQGKLKEWQEQQMSEYIEQMRREQHFESTQRTCNSTILSFIKNLKEQIIKCLDSDSLTVLLKAKSDNKLKIWEDLKIIAFSRVVTVVYACSMLVLLLRVKLSVLGGYMYVNTLKTEDGVTSKLEDNEMAIQEKYLGNVQQLLGPGLEMLAKIVQKVIQQELGSVSLKENLSVKDLENTFSRIRSALENKDNFNIFDDVSSFCLPTEECNVSERGDEINKFQTMVAETRDILETDDCHTVLKHILDIGFSQLLDSFIEFYIGSAQTATSTSFCNPSEVYIAMAKLIPVANGLIHSICSDQPSNLVQQLLVDNSLKSWSANIYIAFVSHEKDGDKNQNRR